MTGIRAEGAFESAGRAATDFVDVSASGGVSGKRRALTLVETYSCVVPCI